MPSHWTDKKSKCDVSLRAELKVKVDFIFDYIQLYHCVKKKDV